MGAGSVFVCCNVGPGDCGDVSVLVGLVLVVVTRLCLVMIVLLMLGLIGMLGGVLLDQRLAMLRRET